jgi:RNA polymerase sigma-70 factor (ECF subfamily)
MREAANILEPWTVPEAIGPDVVSDAALIERFRQGDRDAFTTLYLIHHPAVFRFALLMTADREQAAEITQETFVWLIHHPGEFDAARGGLGPFLGGVARKLLQRHQRHQRRWLPFLDSVVRPLATDPAGDAVRALDGEAVRRAIALLPFHYREAVVLCDLESRSYEEAAAVAECAVGTIRSRLHRGRELLARKFQPKKEAGK